MSGKLSAVAAKMAEKRKAWDDRAQALLDGVEKLDARADAAFSLHESTLANAEAGFKEMEDAVRDLEGGNRPPSKTEGSEKDSDSSFPIAANQEKG